MKNLVFLINHNEDIKLRDLLAKLAASNTRNQIKVFNKLFNEFQDIINILIILDLPILFILILLYLI